MMMANVYLCCGICDLCSRLVDLFFSFIACLVHHDHCLPLSLNSHLFQCVKQKMNFLNFLHRLKIAHFIFVFILAAAAVVIAAVLWKRDLFVYSSSFFRGLLSLWPQGLCVADSFFGRRFRHRNMQSVWQNRNGVIATQSCSLYLQMIIIHRSFGVHYFWFMCYRF